MRCRTCHEDKPEKEFDHWMDNGKTRCRRVCRECRKAADRKRKTQDVSLRFCPVCGKPFYGRAKEAYCSEACRDANRRLKGRGREIPCPKGSLGKAMRRRREAELFGY